MGDVTETDTGAVREPGEKHLTGGKGMPRRGVRPLRAASWTAAVALAACGGLLLYGVLSPQDADPGKRPAVASVEVTYEVTGTGTADITYQAQGEGGKAAVVTAAALPWRTTVRVPLGRTPVVGVVLGAEGGRARCAVAVGGRHVQSATATGGFGRATCAGSVPATGRG
ncbi:hypothetical protein ACFW6K_30670 [Streptomyces sp. NPDC058733]|uniref:hypothetical protein n=1 Tax=Streptomyces sp. NPDC058733 TaxID=3346614 RepID=UPI0036D04391